jgi:hypothetical protein
VGLVRCGPKYRTGSVALGTRAFILRVMTRTEPIWKQMPQLDYIEIGYRPDLGVLVGRWLRPITTEESQEGYRQLLAAAEENRCRFWLMDVRRRPRADYSTVNWLVQEFFPAVAATLGGQLFMGTLLAPSLEKELAGNALLPSAHEPQNQPAQMGRFVTEQEALEWLNQRAREGR